MDKNAIKKYAVWARRELISRVSQKALQYGITDTVIVPATATSVNGVVLSADEMKQRKALIEQINSKGYEQVMEEVAYTWFNRFIALRFMEVNGYLPSHVRVFTDEDNNFRPQILDEAINLEMAGLDMEKVYALKDANDDDSLFKYLVIVQCNALSPILPGMFQRISDYTELLFPDNLLREGSAIQQMIELIPEEDWKDAVQIIGWLYQFYNIEPKADVFEKNGKISKEEIPAATQLFTPDWIVRYMVENSLGRLWVEGHPNEELKSGWRYYLDETEQEVDVQSQLTVIRKRYASITPDQIKCIDPCSGSGHILAYMFDVLMQIYESYGYTAREAVRSIVENNIYGLDIDDRAAQLAYFAVMMKARQYDRRFFTRKDENDEPDVPQPHIHEIVESNRLDKSAIEYFIGGNTEIKKAINGIILDMHDAKEYGSILNVSSANFDLLYTRFEEIRTDISIFNLAIEQDLLPLVKIAEIMSQKYDVVVTNPPYLSVGATEAKLNDYVKKNFPDSKVDLYSVFIEKCYAMLVPSGLQAMITMHSWMFLSSFEKLREKLIRTEIVNVIHLGARAFEEIGGEVVQTCGFVFRKNSTENNKGIFCRLISPTSQDGKEQMFLSGKGRYVAKQRDFRKIPGSRFGYWITDKLREQFSKKTLAEYADTRRGLQTGNSNIFIRNWYEVDSDKTELKPTKQSRESGKKWFLFNSGGSFRRWYGNIVNVVNWENNGFDIKATGKAIIPSEERYFDELVSWNKISTGMMSVRYQPAGIIPGDASPFYHSTAQDTDIIWYAMAVMNSKVSAEIVKVLSPTLNFEVGNIAEIPLDITEETKRRVLPIVERNIQLSMVDWDNFEISWRFNRHPLINIIPKGGSWFEIGNIHLSECYQLWESECTERFGQLKTNEEELNRIFIDIYGLQDELSVDVEDKDVTVRLADKKRDIKSLISYAVGCMFGRYSLDVPGLAYAGGEWDESKYVTFVADKDSIIPICDDEYFADDIVGRFVRFIEVVYGKQSLNENLRFIADALGGSGQPKDVIRKYFMDEFYADHLTIYQKRPIYWMFDSGKKGGFRALVYMHRYQPDTIARMRTDYVHEQQSRYRTAIADLEQRIASASTSERAKLSKRLRTLQEQATEIQAYEEKIHHLADQYISIDLDDGVKKNYAIFGDVLAKIK